MIRVPVNPELLRWARERAGVAQEDLAAKFRKLPEWEGGQTRPTLKQAEAFARALHVPVGYLFLSEPPEEAIPIPDFRTFAGHEVTRPSPNLLDTIYACQERQSWYRDFARVASEPELGFVGSASVETSPETVAAQMRETLGFDLAVRRECPTWTDALRLFIRQADDIGVLVMVSGIVMSNSRRRLDPAEFRGFALCDPLAPLIFVNGKDTKAAQMFTLAHELAHIWLGATAVPSIYSIGPPNDASALRHEHQIDLVDFAIDHEHLAHTRMHRSSAKLSGISRPKPLFGQQSPGFIQPKPSNTKTMAPYRTISRCWLAGNGLVSLSVGTPSKVWRLRNCAT